MKQVVPKTIGACADLLYELKHKRLAIQKQVDEIAEFESKVKEHIINTLPKHDQTGAIGKVAKVTVVTKQIPQLQDKEAFYKWLKRTGEFDVLPSSINRRAIEERWENGKKVPGVEPFIAVTVSLNKL